MTGELRRGWSMNQRLNDRGREAAALPAHPPSVRQAEVMRAVEAAALTAGGRLTCTQVLHVLGWGETKRTALQNHLQNLRARGLIEGLRLTLRGRLVLELPVVAYIAWAVPSEGAHPELWEMAMLAGIEWANMLAARVPGLVPVSPYFTAAAAPSSAGPTLAQRCDAVIVIRDTLLMGRPDVVAAQRAGLPIAVVRDVAECPVDPWYPQPAVRR